MSGESKEHSVPGAEEMEQRLRFWIGQLHSRAPESIGDLLRFRVGPCSPDTGEYRFYASTGDWMKNAFGSLHGGIIGTILDQGMGMLATCLMDGKAITPTVQMQVEYHSPLIPGKSIFVRVQVVSAGKTLIHMAAQAWQTDHEDSLCLSATGLYFYKTIKINAGALES